jgi:hypothetical protein
MTRMVTSRRASQPEPCALRFHLPKALLPGDHEAERPWELARLSRRLWGWKSFWGVLLRSARKGYPAEQCPPLQTGTHQGNHPTIETRAIDLRNYVENSFPSGKTWRRRGNSGGAAVHADLA